MCQSFYDPFAAVFIEHFAERDTFCLVKHCCVEYTSDTPTFGVAWSLYYTLSVGGISSLSSLFSEEAVESYRELLLHQSITQNLTSTQPPEGLRSINESFATHEKRVYEYQEKNINLERVITAMLDHAERAKRYVSSAMVASFGADKTFDKLVAVPDDLIPR